MVVFFHINVSDKSEEIFAEIKTGLVRIPLTLKASDCGITVESPSLSARITPQKTRKGFTDILSDNIFFEKTTMLLHLGLKSGFKKKSLHLDNSIIMILALIENTFGFSLGLKDVSFYIDEVPGFCLDLQVRTRIEATGIISDAIKTIIRR